MPHSLAQKDERPPGDAAAADPLVSCIIIFLNEEKFLAESIESVLTQTYPNWELLLVDDGSSDSSAAIAQSYCEKDPQRIRYLTHEGGINRGMSASRNLGLRESRGPIIALLDADDTWVPEKLEHQVALFKQYPEAVMVCGATLYWHSWQADQPSEDALVFIGDDSPDGRPRSSIGQDRLYPPMELLKRLYPLGGGVSPSTSCITFKRDLVIVVGGFDESFPGLFEDQVFMVKAYAAGPIYISSHCVNFYRQHDESCCYVMTSTGQSRGLRRRFLVWLKNYLDEIGCRDPGIRVRLMLRVARNEYPKPFRLLKKVGRIMQSPWSGSQSRRSHGVPN